MKACKGPQKQLVRKFVHCYGPATADRFADWLGRSGKQGRRMWNLIAEELEPVIVSGKKAFILSADRERLFSQADCKRELLLLGGHDPFLDQRDRSVLLQDKSLHREIWKTTTNPGAILYRGEIIGNWTSKKKSRGMEITMNLWKISQDKPKLCTLAEQYAAFRQQKLVNLHINS